MIPVVLDTSVIISAIGWRGPGHQCVALVARQRCRLLLTDDILAEYEIRVPEVFALQAPHINVTGPLRWIRDKGWHVEPAPLGKRRTRDAKDDPFIGSVGPRNCELRSRLISSRKAFWNSNPPSTPLFGMVY